MTEPSFLKKPPDPHPLLLTRQWVADYRRHDPKPVEAEQPQHATIPLDGIGCPDLHALLDRAGRRRAAELGEAYIEDPFKRPPHQGGYSRITAEEWAEYDRAMAEWQARRRMTEAPR
jgi:hypothetical protein